MPSPAALLDAVLDSWDRNNTILVNLLRLIPADAMGDRAEKNSPSVRGMFSHIHYVRLVFVSEDVPEFATVVPQQEWDAEHDREELIEMLNNSATMVREAVKKRIETGSPMKLHYDHPILMLQHMIWHEGYHHGQIKLALKLAGHPISDDQGGPVTWDVFMRKTSKA